MQTADIPPISPQTLKVMLAERDDVVLLDVREDNEVVLCNIAGHIHIPMNLIPLRYNELPDDKTIVVYCHHGRRSYSSAQFLASVGFDKLYNLEGGIDAWAVQVDPSMVRY